jgi:ABC-type Mn2+/Zn2+ transport system permease subunit/Mn-dependent DtxR family transcriptional regulator
MSTAVAAPRASTVATPRLALSQRLLIALYLGISALAAAIALEWVTRPGPEDVRDLAAPLWTMAVGIVCNASCAILGCYLVLRRMSLLGDAISHAVLPGIALGYLFSGSVAGVPILLGAMALGVLTSVLTQGISSLGRVSEDTSLGVVFTSLFALGVIMIQAVARNVDLDADCVLYGLIDYAGADFTTFLGWTISRPLLMLVPALLITMALVVVFWKELKIVAFDPALAAAMGFRVATIHYLLMAMVAGVTVASFESVGSILVVAMLVVPAATAALLTDRLAWMMAWALAVGTTSAVFGYLICVPLATSVAGAMAVVAGLQFAAAVFFAPRGGLVSRWLRNKGLAIRIAAEDVLAALYRAEEKGKTSAGREPSGISASLFTRQAATWNLVRRGWVTRTPTGQLALTRLGRNAARNLVRAHRLWETYLDTHFDLPRDHLHDAAERMEHYLGTELTDELAAELADRAVDPHGKEIPASDQLADHN